MNLFPAAGLDPPEHLDQPAQSEWRRLAPQIARGGDLTAIQRSRLERYCELAARWRVCLQFVSINGPTYAVRVPSRQAGEQPRLVALKPFPEMSLLVTLSRELTRLESALLDR